MFSLFFVYLFLFTSHYLRFFISISKPNCLFLFNVILKGSKDLNYYVKYQRRKCFENVYSLLLLIGQIYFEKYLVIMCVVQLVEQLTYLFYFGGGQVIKLFQSVRKRGIKKKGKEKKRKNSNNYQEFILQWLVWQLLNLASMK